jgi:hypothetical protein
MLLTPVRASASAVLLGVILAGALAGCSGGDDASDSTSAAAGSDERAGSAAANEVADRARPAGSDRSGSDLLADQRALIKRGTVSLDSRAMGRSQHEVQRVVDEHTGQVTDEETTTDDEGRPAYTRMVLRIPEDDFDDAMKALKGIGELDSAKITEDDVTTKLIDTRSRLRVQRHSIARITTLFERAQSIRDVVAIEAQLSRRQADLDSLERQAAYLTSHTTLATITVSIDRVAEGPVPPSGEDAGFLSGLSAGWHALTTTAVALATVLGALLPWLVVLAVLAPPALVLARVVRRRISARSSARTPSAA